MNTAPHNHRRTVLWLVGVYFILTIVLSMFPPMTHPPLAYLRTTFYLLAGILEVAVTALIFSRPMGFESSLKRNSFAHRSGAFALRVIVCLAIFTLPALLSLYFQLKDTPFINSDLKGYRWANLIAPALRVHFLIVAVGAFIGCVVRNRFVFWGLIAGSFIITRYITVFCQRMLPPDQQLFPEDGIRIFSGFEYLILGTSAAILIMAYKLRFPRSSTTENARRGIPSWFSELFRKELHLQKTNLMFALAALLLGVVGTVFTYAWPQDIAGFSTADIRNGIFVIFFITTFTGIIPIMIGSTAAASEKSLDIWRWQQALPVRWSVVIGVKILVIAILCILLATIPYLFQLTLSDATPLTGMFRGILSIWTSFLLAAAGFYSGTLARDDYQGLLLSIIPIGGLVLVMALADPNNLVFPIGFGLGETIAYEWAMALRFFILAVLFIALASRLLRNHAQRRRFRLADAALIAVLTFGLTLWNIVQERSIISLENFDYTSAPQLQNRPGHGVSGPAHIRPVARGGYADSMKGAVYGLFETQYPTISNILIGTISRHNYPSNSAKSKYSYTMDSSGRFRQFPQSHNRPVRAISSSGSWVLTGAPAKDVYKRLIPPTEIIYDDSLLCGPWALAIPFKWLPSSLQDKIRQWPVVEYEEKSRAIIQQKPEDVLLNMERAGTSGQDRSLVWSGGKHHLPADIDPSSVSVLGNWTSAYFVLCPARDFSSPVTSILKPISGAMAGTFAGWVRGHAEGVTEDYQWAYRKSTKDGHPTPGTLELHKLDPNSSYEDYCCLGGGTTYYINAPQSRIAGTTSSLVAPLYKNLSVISDGQTSAIVTPYIIHGPMKVGELIYQEDAIIEIGLVITDASDPTRSISFPIDNLELPGQDRVKSDYIAPGSIVKNLSTTDSEMRRKFLQHKDGTIALSFNQSIVFVTPPLSDWYTNRSWPISQYVIPDFNFRDQHLLSADQCLVLSNSTLWMIRLKSLPHTMN